MFFLQVLLLLVQILYWLIIIRVIASFLPIYRVGDPWRRLLQVLYDVTEPMLEPIRNVLPRNQMGIDFSPFIAALLLIVLRGILIQIFL